MNKESEQESETKTMESPFVKTTDKVVATETPTSAVKD